MACNSMHFLDLCAYFAHDASGLTLDYSGLDEVILPSKRAGCVEFTGTLRGRMTNCDNIKLLCDATKQVPLEVKAETADLRCHVSRATGVSMIESNNNGVWVREEKPFAPVYQSVLTAVIAEELFSTGQCVLTPYAESVSLHIPMISAYLDFYNLKSGRNVTLCPIT